MISFNGNLKTFLFGVVNCKPLQQIIKTRQANLRQTNKNTKLVNVSVKSQRLRSSSQQPVLLALIWFQVALNVSVLSMTKVTYRVGVVTVLTRSKALRTKLIIVG